MNSYSTLPLPTLYKELHSSQKGLSKKEAALRLKKFGFNEIRELDGVRWYHLLLRQFLNIMVLVLFAALAVSIAVDEMLDAYAILAVIVINTVIGFIQEYKAERAVEALKKMAAPFALVLRDGEKIKVPARELVPGDIIFLEEGMQIPADARLFKDTELQTIESSLTGESLPVEKSIEKPQKNESLGDLKNCVFMGTVVSQGHGEALVVQTGMQSEFGKLAGLVQSQVEEATPLQKQLSRLTKALALFVVGIAIGLFALSFVTGRDLLEMFLLSISLAVSVIPEGLPAVITLTLALGVQRIAKKNAIIRKLSAAETLGSTSVICTDKTGTLTQNKMTVKALYVEDEVLLVQESLKVQSKEMELLLTAGALCNNASLIRGKKDWIVSGDPTEGALLTLAHKAGLIPEKLEKKWPRTREWVFTSERKRMATHNGSFVFMKGAPDSVLEMCTITAGQKKKILAQNNAFAKQAYRVLAVAYKPVKNKADASEEKMIFLGLVAMMDPPRPEVKEAIQTCNSAHIRVVMITGDHALTAQAIGKEIGLYKEGDLVLTGAELEELSFKKLCSLVDKVSIYARVNPSHKVQILKALKQNGAVVSMTGDGVNDAPALKSADIGVAMGITGTDVSKEASDMILVDDNFATIVSTVKEGRVIYRNIKKFIRFLLAANFDEVILVSVTFLLGFPLPFIPLQILWVNLLTDALPAIALGTDKGEADIMNLKPRNPKQGILKELVSFSILAGVLSSAVSLFLFLTVVDDYSIEKTRTLMFSTIVVFELFLVFSVRFEEKHFFTHFFSNKLLLMSVVMSILLQLFAVYHPWMQTLLETEALSVQDWVMMLGASLVAILILELWKHFRVKPIHV